MRKLAKAICAMAALAIPLPSLAQTATFDGTYAGVSRRVVGGHMGTGSTSRCPLPDGVPTPLTITGGAARAGTAENPLTGSVTPQGVLVMHLPNGGKFEGQIDAQGRAAGRITISCAYELVWQRR